jgi:predicted nucleic acid-binding protein
MIYVLDTDIFSLAFRHRPGLRERIARERLSHTVCVGQITRLEALRGRIDAVLKAADAAQALRGVAGLAATEGYLAEFPMSPFDRSAGEHFDRLKDDKKLRKVGQNDLMNACIALAHDATLVTRNTKDFQPIPTLKLENWAD